MTAVTPTRPSPIAGDPPAALEPAEPRVFTSASTVTVAASAARSSSTARKVSLTMIGAGLFLASVAGGYLVAQEYLERDTVPASASAAPSSVADVVPVIPFGQEYPTTLPDGTLVTNAFMQARAYAAAIASEEDVSRQSLVIDLVDLGTPYGSLDETTAAQAVDSLGLDFSAELLDATRTLHHARPSLTPTELVEELSDQHGARFPLDETSQAVAQVTGTPVFELTRSAINQRAAQEHRSWVAQRQESAP